MLGSEIFLITFRIKVINILTNVESIFNSRNTECLKNIIFVGNKFKKKEYIITYIYKLPKTYICKIFSVLLYVPALLILTTVLKD